MNGSSAPWASVNLAAIDLEGTGAQDRDDEMILEIAVVPIMGGLPHLAGSYSTLVNPQRPIAPRPWMSPGLNDAALRYAPALADVAECLGRRVNGHFLVGHNVCVDWRLLERRVPGLAPAGLIDTLRLARVLGAQRRTLTALVDALGVTAAVHAADPAGRPHRALWDATATAMLLPALVRRRWDAAPSIAELLAVAGVAMPTTSAVDAPPQATLF